MAIQSPLGSMSWIGRNNLTPAKHRVLITGLILFGVLFVGFFGMRAFHAFRHIRDGGFEPGHRPPPPTETNVELIRDWMTIPYIAKTYGVSDRMLFNELNIPDVNNREKSLKDLNIKYFPDKKGYLLDEVKLAINKHRPPSPPTAPSP